MALAVIFLVALGLRLWGIRFGLPYAYHVDEPTYVSAALNLGAGIIGRQPNPTGFSNVLFSEYALCFVLGKVFGVFASAADFEQAYRTDPSIFLFLSRVTSAILGSATVLVVYPLGRALGTKLTGLLAAGFLAVAFLHVRDSHYGVPDIAAAFLVAVTVSCCIHGLTRRQPRYIIVAAIASGLATATKWSVWYVVAPVILATIWALTSRTFEIYGQRSRWVTLASIFAGFLSGLIIGGFQLFLQPATYVEYALREAHAGAAGGFGIWLIDTVPGWFFYLKVLGLGLGYPFLVLAVLGALRRLISAIRVHDEGSFLALVFPLTYFLAMGATRHYFARYALPLIPFAAVFAADAIVGINDWVVKHNRRLAPVIAVVLAVVASAQPLAASVRHDILLTRTDTRTLAKEWIEANLPEGAKIALDWQTHGPPLATPEHSEPGATRVFDVLVVGNTGLSEHPIAWYRENRFNYLISSSFISEISLVFPEQDQDRREFYASLPENLEVVRRFGPTSTGADAPFIFDEIYGPAISLWQRERPGPTVTVYGIQP